MKIPKLETKRLILRKIKKEDAQDVSEVGMQQRSTGKIDNEKKAEKWIKKVNEDTSDGFFLGAVLKENNKLIGLLELCHFKWFYRGGEICYYLNKKYRKQGYTTEACKELIDYCFNKIRFVKVYADTEPKNTASQKVLQKLGFKLEGRIRKRHYKCGKWVDELDYGLLKEEWKRK